MSKRPQLDAEESDGGFFERKYKPAGDRGLRHRLYRLLFHHEARDERNFDIALIVVILISVVIVMLDSEATVKRRWHEQLYVAEWIVTVLFTLEYAVRLWVVERPRRYATSFLGIVDLLAILPTFLSLLFPASASLAVVRILRMLRIFRVLKLVKYSDEAGLLGEALMRSRRKILIFVTALLTIAVIFGSLMYVVEGSENGFDSIPTGMYWAVVTMATVGYGDISPATTIGRFLTTALIIIGYSMIVVPTGIYTAELARTMRPKRNNVRCRECGLVDHEADAWHCRKCGRPLPEITE